MSTVVSETITLMEGLKMKEKPQSKLVRTSSLERIKELNNYICAQNYIIFPAIFNWLKSPKDGLESKVDIASAFYRHLLYNILLYKVVEFKILCKSCINQSKTLINTQISKKTQQLSSTFQDSAFLLKLAIYSVVIVVNLEITTCFYLLFAKSSPVGLIFLSICCLWSVVFLLYEGIVHFGNQRRRPKPKIH